MVETSSSLKNVVTVASKSNETSSKRVRTGKLSSRNTRRKRRDHSAKKLKPPIPSFSCSPIIEDEDEEVENEASTLSPSQRVAIKAKPLEATLHAAGKIVEQSETEKRATNKSAADDTTGSAEEISGVSAPNDNLLLQKEDNRSRSVSESVANSKGENDIGCGEPIDNAEKAVNTPSTAAEATSQKLSDETNKSSPCVSATLDPAPISTRNSKEEYDKMKSKNICNNKKATPKLYDMVEFAKTEKKQGSATRCKATETIEILDDDDEHTETNLPLVSRTNSINVEVKEKVPTKPKIQPKKRKRPERDPISVDSSDDEGVAPKKTKAITKKKKPARQKSATTKRKSETNNAANESASGTNKRSRNKLCTACANCKCQAKDDSATLPQQLPTLSLSGSSARVEQTLKNRLLKIERNIALTESQRHECARELKRHRGTIQKKISKTGAKTSKRQHFLADAQVTEQMAKAFATARIDRKDVKKIQTRIFGKRSSCSKSEPQPTLTQMFGGGTEGDEDGSDDSLSAKEDNQSCSGDASSADESSQADPHDSLSFWNDESIHATHQFIGSMAQFDEASSRFKDKQAHNTTAWTKATTNVIKTEEVSQTHEEEEGIDALLELFDISPKKKPGSVSCHEECNDSFLQSQLSQSGAIAAQRITEEIAKDDAKRAAIEKTCPNWKENVEYSFRRKDSEGLENALNEVKKERQRLEDARDRILQAFLERSSTLDVYEKAIEGSLKRLADKENDST